MSALQMIRLLPLKLALAGLAVFVGNHAFAQRTTHGDWIVQTAGSLGEAFTSNPSESTLGVICDSGIDSCKAYLDVNLECTGSAPYPALISSERGAANIEMKCYLWKTQKNTRHLFTFDFDRLVAIAAYGTKVGFALPLDETGEFRAVRYSLDGAVKAFIALKEALQRGPKRDRNL